MLSDVRLELIPTELPAHDHFSIDEADARATALHRRPEINQALKEIQAANVRLNISKNELRPNLDLVLEAYLTGLQGNYDIGQAFTDQFTRGAPGYTAGLVYEYPWNNRAARAQLQRRQLELRRLTAQFDASLQQLSAEVEVAVREVQTTYEEMLSKHQSMVALETEMDYLTQRWQLLPGDDRSASFMLRDLLDVQELVAREELGFARAQIDYTMALAEIKRATGTLLQFERITRTEIEEEGMPHLIFDKLDR
jgi:outer membrane protein TolC